MRKLLFLFIILIIGSFISSCSSKIFENKLTEKEAKKIISEALKYPQLREILYDTQSDTKCALAINKLVKEGYFKENPDYSTAYLADNNKYIASTKGAPYMKSIFYIAGQYHLVGSTQQIIIKEIKEILTDEENKTAVVTFVIGFEPIEPFFSTLCVEGKCVRYLANNDCSKDLEEELMKITLKKYDKGWRVMQ